MKIGDFGTDPAASEEFTFGWFGHDIRVDTSGASDLAFMDFMEKATNVDEEDAEAVLLVKGYLREVIHAEDFDTFWRLAREHRQNTQDLMKVAAEVVAAVVNRPSRPSFDSPAGTSPTEAKSKDGSYSRAIQDLHGRPDLQLAVARARGELVSVN